MDPRRPASSDSESRVRAFAYGVRMRVCQWPRGQQDNSHALKRPMTAGNGASGQRSHGTRRNLLLSHRVPRQPRRPHAPCTGKGCLTESITAAPVDEPRIAGGLGGTCVPAGDGSRRRRLPRRRAGVRHKSSLSAQPAATMSESSIERISGHRSATLSSASGDREYSRVVHEGSACPECWFGSRIGTADGLVYLCGDF
jgi:hypothetical protein